MKKLLAIIFVFVFALSFSACRQTFTIEGKWEAPITVMGETIDSDKNYIIVEFNEDGTGSYTTVNYDRQVSHAFTYEIDGNFMTVKAYSGSLVYECEYSIKGDELIIETDEKTIVHRRYTEN